MSEFFLGVASDDEIQFDGFYDGQQKTIPDNTELEGVVIDGFNGIEEGKAIQTCFVQVAITTPGEFLGQKYKYNAKIYDMDAAKRDRAMKNLTLLDTQAGSPLGKGRLPLTTENIQEHWVGASNMRIKFGLTVMEDEQTGAAREINFIRGFGYLREKLPQKQAAVQQPHQSVPQNDSTADDSEVDF